MRRIMVLIGTVSLLVAGLAAPAQASYVQRHKVCAHYFPGAPAPVRTCAIRYPLRPVPRFALR